MKQKNLVTLKKCSYIFHWSNDNFSFAYNRSEKAKINKTLKKIYDGGNNVFSYTEKNGKIYINIEGIEICLNDKMILKITGEKENQIINNIKFVPFSDLLGSCDLFKNLSSYSDNEVFYSKKFKSFEMESFFSEDGLYYYRLSFKGSSLSFVVSNNLIYRFSDTFEIMSKKEIFAYLGVSSDKARKEISTIIDYITNY